MTWVSDFEGGVFPCCPCNNIGFGMWTRLNVSTFPIWALISYSMTYLSLLGMRPEPETATFAITGRRSLDL